MTAKAEALTNATQGRRPEGPGAYLYQDVQPVIVERIDGRLQAAYWIRIVTDDGPLFDIDPEYVDDMPGDFIPLTPPVAAPEPDWSSAPEWAMWWAVEHAHGTLGMAYWFGGEPVIQYSEWVDFPGTKALYNPVDLPLGVDWRTTLRKRPEVSGE